MNRIAMLRWFGTGALGLGLVAGCSHSRPATVSSGSSPRQVACTSCNCANGGCGTPVAAGSQARAVPMYTSAATVPAPGYGRVPTPKMTDGVVQVGAQSIQPAPQAAGQPATQPVEAPPQAGTLKSPFTRGEAPPARKSFVDITASACFDHAPDYSSVSGQLEHVRATNTWKLRYLSVDESDSYGGSVTLTGDTTQLANLKDGQYVKVDGHLCDPDRKGIAPAYRIEVVRPLGN